MGRIDFLLGRSRGARARALAQFDLPKDALGRRRCLSLRPTRRSLRAQEQRAALASEFLPSEWVLSDFLAEVAARHASPRSLLTGSALALRMGRFALGQELPDEIHRSLSTPELGQHLARSFEAYQEALGSPAGLPVWLSNLFRNFENSLADGGDWTSLGEALLGAAKGRGLGNARFADLLAGHPFVFIDDAQSLSAARLQLLLRIIENWMEADTHVLLSLNAPRPLTGDQLLNFFTLEEEDPERLSFRSFDAAAPFRRACFDRFVGDGQARFLWAGDHGLEELEPGAQRTNTDASCLADHFYSTSSSEQVAPLIEGAVGRLTVSNPAEILAECRNIAGQIKWGLQEERWTLHETAVAVPDLPAYAPCLLQVFEDYGLPLDLSSGKHLIRSPLGGLLACLLRLSTPAAGPVDYLDLVATSPPVKGLGVEIGILLRTLQKAKVRGNRPRQWKQDLNDWLKSERRRDEHQALFDALDVLDTHFEECVAPLQRKGTAENYFAGIRQSLEALGYPQRLLTQQASRGETKAWGAVVQLLDQCHLDFLAIHKSLEKEWAIAELSLRLKETSYRPERPDSNAVSVLGTLELRGLAPQHLWLAGLHRGAFPGRRGSHPLVESATWTRLQAFNPMAEARALFIGLIQEALLEGDHSLHLSWPQRINGKDQSPAPPLADLLDLEPEILDSLRPAPVPKGLRRSEHLYVGQGPGSEDCSSQLQAQKRRSLVRDQAPLGPFDGTLGLSTEERIPLSVTRLERYVQCPARDWYANRLGLADEDERTEDANSLTRGSLLHDVLEKFVRESLEDYRKTVPPRDALAARLAQTAESAIADPRLQPSMSEDARNGLREHWLPGLLDDRPKGLLAAWLDREIERIPQRIPIAVEASLEGLHLAGHPLKGRIDRVDQADTDGLLIVDYKTGSPPTGKKVARGLALQGFLYTEGAALLWPNTGPRASVYTQISRADTLKDAAWLGDKDLIKSLSPSARPTVLDSEKHAQLLHHAEAAADALTRGVHHPTLATTEEAGCSYCEFRSICRFDDLRAQAISEDSQSCGPLETS